jgi:hypothetical protein
MGEVMEKQLKKSNGRSLAEIINSIVKESLKSSLHRNAVEEKEKQSALDEKDDLFADEEKSSGEEKEKPSKTVDADKEKLTKGEVSADDIVDRLNSIRSGKSFKDDAVASKLEEYVDSLSKPERVALLAFLKGLSQIVTGEVEPQQAVDPSSHPANVKMEKGDEKKTKSIKPNVIKAPEKAKSEKKSPEDTSGPVPITPKKK